MRTLIPQTLTGKSLWLCLLITGVLLCIPVISFAYDSMCFEKAGELYNISPELLESLAVVESGKKTFAKNHNTNGSVDVCHMQVNSFWKQYLKEGKWDYLQTNTCYCTIVGAWILGQCVERYGYNWNAVACYHTGKSLNDSSTSKRELGEKYIAKVKTALSELKGK